MNMPSPPPEPASSRSLEVGGVFDRVFSIYRAQAGLLLPAALIVFLPIAVLSALFQTGGGAGLLFLTLVLAFVGSYWYQGMVVQAVRDMLDGRRDFTVGGLFSAAAPFVGPLIGVGLLAGVGIAIGLFLLIVPGLFLLTIWAVIVPVVVLERSGVLPAFGRSAELTRGNRWPVFGVIVLLFLLQFAVGVVLGFVAEAAGSSLAAYALTNLAGSVLVAPLASLAATVIYLELRRLREGAVV